MTTLLLIDVQNDFHPGGSLAIPAAGDDATRTAAFIRKHASSISRIIMTMDSHHKLHIAHPSFWRDAAGNRPAPFTLITKEDVESGSWIPRSDLRHGGKRVSLTKSQLGAATNEEFRRTTSLAGAVQPLVDESVMAREGPVPDDMYDDDGNVDVLKYCVEYTRRLEKKGRFTLCIWPEHCLIGTAGHNVVPEVMEAVHDWSDETGGSVEWVDKGQNLLTECYSALCAEVPVSEGSDFDEELFESIRDGTERLLIAGQALSHCVASTARDIVAHWPAGERGRLTVLRDCASSVPGFEGAGETFLEEMRGLGVRVETSEEFQP